MISIKGANKTYGKGENIFYALKNVDLDIEEKELVVILGASGSGKSTLLNLIGGIDKGDSGEITACNTKLNKISDRELTKYRANNIGFVFQFYNLIQNLTVWENIEVVREIAENPLGIDEVLKAVDLLDQKDKYPTELSGGQQQRVAIARALVKRPKLLLCDEPTGALDYKTSKDVLKLLSKVNIDFGTTILIITHNGPIAQIADRIIKLRSGEVVSNSINNNKISIDGVEW